VNAKSRSFHQVLLRLLQHSQAAWRTTPVSRLLRRAPIDEIGLYGCFKGSLVKIPPQAPGDTLFPLPPLTKARAFIPLLGVNWDFDSEYIGNKLTVCFAPKSGPTGQPTSPTQAMILRFELQEQPPWNFSHVQFCLEENLHSGYTGLDRSKISDRLPRIPLAGIDLDAAGLLLVLVTSLYGVKTPEFKLIAGAIAEDTTAGPLSMSVLQQFVRSTAVS
jgi:hypothetical protein